MAPKEPLTIRIVGGSLAGLFCAVLLHRAGHDVLVYERSGADLSKRGAGLVGGRELFDVLRLLGCEHVANLAFTASSQVLIDYEGDVYSEREVTASRFSWDLLYKEARSRLPSDMYIQNRRVVGVEDGPKKALLLFEDGQKGLADLVIGADGIGSIVRKSVDPRNHLNRYAGYVAWRAVVPEGRLSPALLPLKEKMVAFSAPGIQSIGYMVPGPSGETELGSRRFNWGWYRPVAEYELKTLLTDRQGRPGHFSVAPGQLREAARHLFIADAVASLPPQFAEIAATAPDLWIQGIFDYSPKRMSGSHVALVGDAACVARPPYRDGNLESGRRRDGDGRGDRPGRRHRCRASLVFVEAATRVRAVSFWQALVFVLESLLFVLIGLSLRSVVVRLDGSLKTLYADVLTVIVARFVWISACAFVYSPRGGAARAFDREALAEIAIVGWSGMRGVVTLAAALAFPDDLPGRDLVLLSSFAVIVVTVLAQGTTLAPLARLLGITSNERDETEKVKSAIRKRLKASGQTGVAVPVAIESDKAAALLKHPMSSAVTAVKDSAGSDKQTHETTVRRITQARTELLRLYRKGDVRDDVLREIEYELDLEEMSADSRMPM